MPRIQGGIPLSVESVSIGTASVRELTQQRQDGAKFIVKRQLGRRIGSVATPGLSICIYILISLLSREICMKRRRRGKWSSGDGEMDEDLH